MLAEAAGIIFIAINEQQQNPGNGDGLATTQTIALYSMISAIVVALLGFGAQIIVAKYNRGPRPDTNEDGSTHRRRPIQEIDREHEAFERWLLLNGYDPRKIETGDEPIEMVRLASE